MSTAINLFDLTARGSATSAETALPSNPAVRRHGVGSLAVLFLAAFVAALVILADRFIITWADEHLFFGWVLLWAVVFAGLALFAGAARALAARAMGGLDAWSRALAGRRAEARLWHMARHDPRVMADLVAIRAHAETDNDFGQALAPLGMERDLPSAEARGWVAYLERVGKSRVRNMHLQYI